MIHTGLPNAPATWAMLVHVVSTRSRFEMIAAVSAQSLAPVCCCTSGMTWIIDLQLLGIVQRHRAQHVAIPLRIARPAKPDLRLAAATLPPMFDQLLGDMADTASSPVVSGVTLSTLSSDRQVALITAAVDIGGRVDALEQLARCAARCGCWGRRTPVCSDKGRPPRGYSARAAPHRQTRLPATAPPACRSVAHPMAAAAAPTPCPGRP